MKTRFRVIQIHHSAFDLLSSVLNKISYNFYDAETLFMIVKFRLPKRFNLRQDSKIQFYDNPVMFCLKISSDCSRRQPKMAILLDKTASKKLHSCSWQLSQVTWPALVFVSWAESTVNPWHPDTRSTSQCKHLVDILNTIRGTGREQVL